MQELQRLALVNEHDAKEKPSGAGAKNVGVKNMSRQNQELTPSLPQNAFHKNFQGYAPYAR